MNYVSCSPFRVPIARLAAAQAAFQYPEFKIDNHISGRKTGYTIEKSFQKRKLEFA
jgi:hypothetical protein